MGKGEQKSNRYRARIEFAATHRKQTKATISNRYKIAPPAGCKLAKWGAELKHLFWLLLLASSVIPILGAVSPRVAVAQERRERTIDEVKAEAITRAENGMYPLIALDPADIREAFASIKTSDPD